MVRGAMAALLAMEDDLEVWPRSRAATRSCRGARAATRTSPCSTSRCRCLDGLAAAAALRTAPAGCRVLIVTTFGRPGYLRQAMAAGATGFLLKDAPASELAVGHPARGGRSPGRRSGAGARCPGGGREPADRARTRGPGRATAQATIAEIAASLSLSEGTVRNHLSAAIQKVGARNRAEAARIARDKGWLEPGD